LLNISGMKISTLRANFKFPRGFVFCATTHKIYLPFERVGSKYAFPKFEEEYETPWIMNDYSGEEILNARWDTLLQGKGDIDVFPTMLTRCPYERFISAFEVMVFADSHWPEELFSFQMRKVYNLESYLDLNPYNTSEILNCFNLFVQLICRNNLDYNFINPITDNFKNLDVLDEIEIIDLYEFTKTSHNKNYVKEKVTKITKQEYFADSITKALFDKRFAQDIIRFGYSL